MKSFGCSLCHNCILGGGLDVYKIQELDRELQRLIGKRAAEFYEYAISLQNDCLVCSCLLYTSRCV